MGGVAPKGLSYAKRMHWPRALGLGLGVIAIAGALYAVPQPTWVWMALLCHGYVWPHVAYLISSLSKQPYAAERRNFVYDSLAAGFWAGAVGLNPLPVAATLAMIAMNNIAAGGFRLWLIGSLGQALGALLGYWTLAPELFPAVTQLEVYTSLPVLILYPMAIGIVSYQVAVKLSESRKAIQKLSSTDSLTGLLNHGAWKDCLIAHFDTCQHEVGPSTLALIDVDYFKAINDTYGHLAGDRVLKQIGQSLSRGIRGADIAGRYGGDEFCVIFPGASKAEVVAILERVRLQVGQLDWAIADDLRLGLSIGVAEFDSRLESASAWLHQADVALYLAKKGGRNRICLDEASA